MDAKGPFAHAGQAIQFRTRRLALLYLRVCSDSFRNRTPAVRCPRAPRIGQDRGSRRMAGGKMAEATGLFTAGLSSLASAVAPSGSRRKSRRKLSMSETIKTLKARGINVVHSDQTPEWYMIDARTSVHIAKWDFTLVLALLLVAILTPFEVAFMPPPQAIDWLFVMNRVLDVIFAVDMVVVCFRITSVTSNIDGMRWIVEPGELFRRYCKSGWFFIDLFTLIVSAMDIVTPMLEGDGAKSVRKLKVGAALPVRRDATPHSAPSTPSARPWRRCYASCGSCASLG